MKIEIFRQAMFFGPARNIYQNSLLKVIPHTQEQKFHAF